MTRLIDADALIKTAIKPARPGTFNVKYNYSEMRTRFLRFIDNQPTIDAVPVRHAKWISVNNLIEGKVICSDCRKVYDWDTEAQYFDYCPKCGARMDEE